MSCNLLSINKLAKSQNCFVTFFPIHCVIQNLTMGKMMDYAKERGDLYYLVTKEQGKIQAHQNIGKK